MATENATASLNHKRSSDGDASSDDSLEAVTDIVPTYDERPDSSHRRDAAQQSPPPQLSSSAPAVPRKSESPVAPSSNQRSKPRRVIGNYTLVRTLGSGSMGKVKLAMHNITQDKLAVKIVPKSFAGSSKNGKDDNREVRTIREASIMLLLYHPHIVSLKEMVDLDPYYYLFMEYVGGGQLLDFIIAHGKLKEKHARRFARQIVSALDYCHRNSIVHRDLKIENILISTSGHVKIIDFGLSNLFSPRSHLSTFCGSLYFAAPELLNAKAYTGPEVDVWSFGIVLYVLVCGKVPFDDQNMPALHAKIKRGHVEYPSHLSSECKNLLSRMLVTNPNHRATISEIIVHPWMNRGYDNIVDSHLPDRAPLMLPVDSDVIRNMTGFGFGTELEIKQQLEAIITSEEYQKAAKTLIKRSRGNNPSRYNNHHHTHSTISLRKSYTMPNDDPQSIPAAYHPLVSIYYLVKERMERERRALEASDDPQLSANTTSSQEGGKHTVPHSSPMAGIKLPHIPRPETAHSVDGPFEHLPFTKGSAICNHHCHHQRHHHHHLSNHCGTSDTIFGRQGRTTTKMDDEGHTIEADRPNVFENGIQRLMSRRRTSESSSNGDENVDGEQHQHSNMFRRLSSALLRTSLEHKRRPPSTEITPLATVPTVNPSTSADNKASHPHRTGTSLGHKVSCILNRTGSVSTTTTTTAEPKRGRPRQSTVSGGRPFDAADSACRASDGGAGRTTTTTAKIAAADAAVPSGKTPAQRLPEALESTSTPAAPNSSEIHSHEQSFPQSANGLDHRGTADDTVKQVFLKGLFSVTTTSTKHPSVIRADLIRVLERIGVKWRESKGRFECVHMPSIDMNRVKPEDSPSASAAIAVPDLIVRFEIHIVKVSWLLGMHGLQFRRVSGDSWLYKNMCSRILAELKL
ncbi:hypothetical protein BX666DRAFT_1982764 [Dichotomocladium elegans]|nr:hypothetical protein BX666DRAFT_1982764 [Dichotomocladium elegans]